MWSKDSSRKTTTIPYSRAAFGLTTWSIYASVCSWNLGLPYGGPPYPFALFGWGGNGIWAKPIVDILVELPDDAAIESAKVRLAAHGYLAMADRDLNKGYTPEGFAERVFHVHLRIAGDNDEIYFRDYLNAHPDVAQEYERLKLSLWKEFEHDRDGYTQAKAAFVRKYTDLAKAEHSSGTDVLPC